MAKKYKVVSRCKKCGLPNRFDIYETLGPIPVHCCCPDLQTVLNMKEACWGELHDLLEKPVKPNDLLAVLATCILNLDERLREVRRG